MVATIPCINPAHGVKNHVSGSTASAECERTGQNSGYVTSLKGMPMKPAVAVTNEDDVTTATEREPVSKAQALRELKAAKSATITSFKQKNYRTGELAPAKHLFAGTKRKVAGGNDDSVRFDDDSSIHIDRNSRCYRGDNGELIIQGIDGEGEPWVELTYSIDK